MEKQASQSVETGCTKNPDIFVPASHHENSELCSRFHFQIPQPKRASSSCPQQRSLQCQDVRRPPPSPPSLPRVAALAARDVSAGVRRAPAAGDLHAASSAAACGLRCASPTAAGLRCAAASASGLLRPATARGVRRAVLAPSVPPPPPPLVTEDRTQTRMLHPAASTEPLSRDYCRGELRPINDK